MMYVQELKIATKSGLLLFAVFVTPEALQLASMYSSNIARCSPLIRMCMMLVAYLWAAA